MGSQVMPATTWGDPGGAVGGVDGPSRFPELAVRERSTNGDPPH